MKQYIWENLGRKKNKEDYELKLSHREDCTINLQIT